MTAPAAEVLARRGRAGLSLWLPLLMAGCASVAPEAVVPVLSSAAEQRPPARGDDALSSFERRQRALAEAATQQRRWADAVWAWDVVLALRPGDANAQEQRAKAQSQADEAAADRSARAQQARQRGDAETAARLYLETLALAPADRAAADALRELERQRARRGNVLGYRSPGLNLVRRPGDGGWMLLPQTRAATGLNELEHASLLAKQGDLDAAIAMLQPLASGRQTDPAVRSRLAELYWRKAEQLAPKDPKAAVAALEQCLKWEPGHPQASARLKALRVASSSAAPASPAAKSPPKQ
jgi:tetratricopeptide (TPR) repeat protein